MEVFSAAINLLAIFLCLIVFIPIILMIILFLGYDKLSTQTQSLFKSGISLIKALLKMKSFTSKNSKPSKKVVKKSSSPKQKVKVEDAEFREVI